MREYQAVVVGATGAVGSALLKELVTSPLCTGVVALVRHQPEWPESFASTVTPRIIDFAHLEQETASLSQGCTVAFNTMGIGQPRKVSEAEFRKVDVEYAEGFARGAQQAGVAHISLLSSIGANLDSRNRYLRVKGEAEAATTSAGVERTSIFRPSVLITPEVRYGFQDHVLRTVMPLVSWAIPRRFHEIRVEDLARAMRVNVENPGQPGVEILQYPEIAQLFGGSSL